MKKPFVSLVAALLFLLSFSASAQEAAPAKGVKPTLRLSSGQGTGSLTDASIYTKVTLAGGTVITVDAPEDFSTLYLIWDRPVGEYQLAAGDEIVTCGKNGFLHESISLASPRRSVEITLPKGGILCDIYLFASGKTPQWVQVWQPPLDKADLLVLPTHADDEHLFFGGTMPYYAGELGLDVQVCYFTNHWGEPYRPHELLNGLWTVGIKAYPVISESLDRYFDNLEGAKAYYGENKMIKFQTELIRRFKPYVIVAHDLNGEYGHGAHMLNAHTLTKALEVCGDESAYPDLALQYGVWNPLKTYLHLYGENTLLMNWDIPLNNFGGKTAFQMAEAGFACHKSQQTYFKVSKSGVFDCRAFGLYKTMVGTDTLKNDFFEHIDLAQLKNPPQPAEESFLPQSSSQAPDSSSQSAPPSSSSLIAVVGVLTALAVAGGVIRILTLKKKG